ncbi:uncharacterized protein LOC117321434 [Pecten maximus]|uniref:uncharacterized protein LOC117321434 n=1 Tax=Pecten maximus TaxID=6579 RepID=UPI001458B771|nr:uncharacterized protein LOC117321434 [Pecten maximus]
MSSESQAGVAVEKEQYDTGLSLSFGEVDDVDDEVKRKYTIVDLLSSSEKGDVEELDTIVRHGIPVHSTTKSGSSVLHYAARNGQSEMIRHLIDNYPACHVKVSMMESGYFSEPRSSLPADKPHDSSPSESGIRDAADKYTPEGDETPHSRDVTLTHTKEDSYDIVQHLTPEVIHRNWIGLHRSAAEGNSYDVLRMIENGANTMKKINSAFFPNIHLKPKQMLTPLEVAFFSGKEEMTSLLIRYTDDDIVRRCLSMCANGYVTLKPYIVKGMLEKQYKDKFIEVVFGEYKPKKQKMFIIYTDVIAHGSETNEAGYPVQFRNPSVSSDESRKALYHCQQNNYILSEDDRILVARAIKQHSDKLWKNHSNLRGILSSPVKSVGGSFKKQTCLVILCHFKGFVPDKELAFPPELKVGNDTLPVDVREGHVVLHHVHSPNALHQPLSFGCNIGTADDPTLRFGSIGPFVELQDGKIGFITCAHVVNGPVTYVEDSVPNIPVLQPSTGNTGYPEDDRICGEVVYLKYSLNEATSIDIAIVEITVPARAPLSPGFAAFSQGQLSEQGIPENQPIFDHGEYGEPTVGETVIKFGSASGVTYGTYRGIETAEFNSRIYGRVSETERWRGIYYIENRQCSEDDCHLPPFSTHGDSGAGVFQIRDNSLICVGILVGADEATGSGIVIPIKPVLETSGCNLKVFRPRT